MTTSVPANVDDDELIVNTPIPFVPDGVWTDMSYFRSKLVGEMRTRPIIFNNILAFRKHNSKELYFSVDFSDLDDSVKLLIHSTAIVKVPMNS